MVKIDGNKLTADAGMMLTNGEACGKTVWLAVGDDVSKWREIMEEEAEAIMEQISDAEALAIITGGEHDTQSS